MSTDTPKAIDSRNRSDASVSSRAKRIGGLIAAGIFVALTVLSFSSKAERLAAQPAGSNAGRAAICAPGSKVGRADYDDSVQTPAGLPILVRTPLDYDPSRAYRLLVVFPPAGLDRKRSELFYRLTSEATRHGFVVAYSDHVPLSGFAVSLQAAVAASVAGRFCIDRDLTAYLGHSDGGSMAEGVPAFMPGDRVGPAVVVASAAGITGTDLASAACPRIPAVLIVHSRDDERFPGFGWSAALYWAGCAGCAKADIAMASTGCRSFEHCGDGRRVAYCETDGRHESWPDMNRAILDFVQGGGIAWRRNRPS